MKFLPLCLVEYNTGLGTGCIPSNNKPFIYWANVTSSSHNGTTYIVLIKLLSDDKVLPQKVFVKTGI